MSGSIRQAPHGVRREFPDQTTSRKVRHALLSCGMLYAVDPLVAVIGRRQERAIWGGLKHYMENDVAAQPPKDGSA